VCELPLFESSRARSVPGVVATGSYTYPVAIAPGTDLTLY